MLNTRNYQSWLWILTAFCLAAGLYARFKGLGTWPLAVDEYYLVKSIYNVISTGLPAFDCGGHYTRGLLQQYLTAPLILIGVPTELAARLIPVVSNILTIPAIYLIARKVSNKPIACIAISIFALSLWQIEFARFARMYAPFQCIFAWQLYTLLQAVDDDNPKRMASLGFLLVFSLLSIFIYEGAIFVILLGFVPMLLQRCKVLSIYNAILCCITLFAVYMQITDFRHIGAGSYLPSHITLEDLDIPHRLPVALPGLALSKSFSIGVLIAAVIAFFSGIWAVKAIRTSRTTTVTLLYFYLPGLISILLAANNLMLLAWSALIASMLLIAFKQDIELKGYFRWTAWLIVISIIWFAVFYMKDDVTAFKIFDGQSDLRAIIQALFLYPDVYTRIIGQWLEAMPIFTLFMLFGCGSSFVFTILNRAFSKFEPLLLALLLGFVLLVSVLETTYLTPRYSYFMYPLFIVCSVIGYAHLISTLKPLIQPLVTAACLIIVVTLSDDAGFQHIVSIDSAKTNFRLDIPEDRGNMYYPRSDYRFIANYIKENRKAGDKVLSMYPVIDFYYPELDMFYVPTTSEKFPILSACTGTKELWSSASLIYTPDALHTALSESSTWVVVKSPEFSSYEEERALWHQHQDNIVASSVDKRLNLLYLKKD